MPELSEIERDLQTLALEMRRLESEYNMFFGGRLPRPPFHTRSRVEGIIRKWDRAHIDSLSMRFRFATVQSRFATFCELWDRGLRAREEGRQGPFARGRPRETPREKPESDGRIMHVTALSDPAHEEDKLQELYESLMKARREAGEREVPFTKFASLIGEQVSRLQKQGAAEVAFRVAVTNGKANLTLRAVKGSGKTGSGSGSTPAP